MERIRYNLISKLGDHFPLVSGFSVNHGKSREFIAPKLSAKEDFLPTQESLCRACYREYGLLKGLAALVDTLKVMLWIVSGSSLQ